MNKLAAQQQAFLQTLFSSSLEKDPNAINLIANYAINTPATATKDLIKYQERGLQVYHANAQVTALRNLQAAYPVIEQLVGGEAFGLLARDLWQQFPPTFGDAAQWGDGLAQLISSIAELDPEPYLPDVARIEWALHQAAAAADTELDVSSLVLLTTHVPDAITLQLAPGTQILTSLFPAASIVMAHVYDSPSFDDIQTKMRAHSPESAIIWRQGYRPCVVTCSAADAVFIQNILSGSSLAQSLDAIETVDSTPAFDFNTWLTQSAQSGLLVGAKILSAESIS
ncbi:MAG TPA: DNA-binding domain-containing protein [Burkholderiaceae bacterium]|nr:DNA-binding domain-containing protein [Burkholderiaceae bacterium]